MNFLCKNMRKIIALLSVCVAIFAFMAVPSYATEDEPIDFGQFYGIIDADTLNVRAYASEEAIILKELPKYTYVRVNWIEPEWVCISYDKDNVGLIGYVSAEYIKVFEGEAPDMNSTAGISAVNIATQFLGVPYVWGGTSPSGFDCSGLMQYVYKQLGYNINRVADAQMKNGIAVSRENLAPGDIIGFSSGGIGGYVSHVGMYVGDGMMIHAPHSGDVVKYTTIDSGYYSTRFAGARRIIY